MSVYVQLSYNIVYTWQTRKKNNITLTNSLKSRRRNSYTMEENWGARIAHLTFSVSAWWRLSNLDPLLENEGGVAGGLPPSAPDQPPPQLLPTFVGIQPPEPDDDRTLVVPVMGSSGGQPVTPVGPPPGSQLGPEAFQSSLRKKRKSIKMATKVLFGSGESGVGAMLEGGGMVGGRPVPHPPPPALVHPPTPPSAPSSSGRVIFAIFLGVLFTKRKWDGGEVNISFLVLYCEIRSGTWKKNIS